MARRAGSPSGICPPCDAAGTRSARPGAARPGAAREVHRGHEVGAHLEQVRQRRQLLHAPERAVGVGFGQESRRCASRHRLPRARLSRGPENQKSRHRRGLMRRSRSSRKPVPRSRSGRPARRLQVIAEMEGAPSPHVPAAAGVWHRRSSSFPWRSVLDSRKGAPPSSERCEARGVSCGLARCLRALSLLTPSCSSPRPRGCGPGRRLPHRGRALAHAARGAPQGGRRLADRDRPVLAARRCEPVRLGAHQRRDRAPGQRARPGGRLRAAAGQDHGADAAGRRRHRGRPARHLCSSSRATTTGRRTS